MRTERSVGPEDDFSALRPSSHRHRAASVAGTRSTRMSGSFSSSSSPECAIDAVCDFLRQSTSNLLAADLRQSTTTKGPPCAPPSHSRDFEFQRSLPSSSTDGEIGSTSRGVPYGGLEIELSPTAEQVVGVNGDENFISDPFCGFYNQEGSFSTHRSLSQKLVGRRKIGSRRGIGTQRCGYAVRER